MILWTVLIDIFLYSLSLSLLFLSVARSSFVFVLALVLPSVFLFLSIYSFFWGGVAFGMFACLYFAMCVVYVTPSSV